MNEITKEEINGLSMDGALVLGAWLLERKSPYFDKFCTETGWTGWSVLRGALYRAWSIVEEGSDPVSEVTSEMCQERAPDSEDYSSLYTSAAIDAANMASMLIEFVENCDKSIIHDMVLLSVEGVDLSISLDADPSLSGEILEEYISAHPRMCAELSFLRQCLESLQGIYASRESWISMVLTTTLIIRRSPLSF